MKKFIPYIYFALLSLNVQGQTTYVKLRLSPTILGSTTGIVKGMEDAGYGPKGLNSFFGTVDYPQKLKYPALEIEKGFYVTKRTSLSFLIGFENAGHVKGYSSHSGAEVELKHAGYVFSPKFNVHNRLSLLGAGPTFMAFHYRDYVDRSEIMKATKFFPGLSLTAETLFNDKKSVSLGMFGTLNLYGGSTTQIIAPGARTGSGYAAKINPTNIQLGLFFRFQHA